MNTDIRKYCQNIPKVELHAHLNTSFSKETIQHLIERKAAAKPEVRDFKVFLNEGENEPLETAFNLFKLIHQICDDEYSIYKLTYDVIHEFAEDNVKYLELRSTPKDIPHSGITRQSYIETMIRAVKACQDEKLDIMVKILPSIDRRHGIDIANITVDLANELSKKYPGYVPGIDFSGDPKFLNAADYIPVFNRARDMGLKLALHLAEIPNYEETLQVLRKSTPDRIGHGTYLHNYKPGEDLEDLTEIVIKKQIPLEHCLTSNLKSQTAASYEEHHFKYWYDIHHPQIICTDGKGVFCCQLWEEYYTTAKAFNLNQNDLWNLSYNAIDYTFATTEEKDQLKMKWNEYKKSCFTKN